MMNSPSALLTKPMPNIPSLALRPREAAAALGMSERALWSLTHRGEIPHIRVGKIILYPVDALRRWLDQQAAHSAAVEGGQHE